ncbi:hypothetical protein [Pseudonocardia sp. T1-2H]|uniref:hypothetical protein n=1 Tax=Pseudonocardia sp. T1-2H TaxID=3128899 RepID=UPI0031017E55
MSRTVHLTLQPGFTGDIRFTDDGMIVRPLPAAAAAVTPAVEPSSTDPAALRVGRILDRFARHAPEVKDVHDQLISLGWTAVAPEPTKATENEEYLRLLYVGRKDRVTLYLNTRNITCANVGVKEFAATLESADQRPNGNVCFYFDGTHNGSVRTAIAAAAALISFADQDD